MGPVRGTKPLAAGACCYSKAAEVLPPSPSAHPLILTALGVLASLGEGCWAANSHWWGGLQFRASLNSPRRSGVLQ